MTPLSPPPRVPPQNRPSELRKTLKNAVITVKITMLNITVSLSLTVGNHLKALAAISGETPEQVAEFLLNDAILSAVEDPELLGNNE